jgi:hypothetical protein
VNYRTIASMAGQRQAELHSQATECRRKPGRIIPHWRLTWSRTTLPGDQPSVVLIISATRTS